jgi:hypothetical protein
MNDEERGKRKFRAGGSHYYPTIFSTMIEGPSSIEDKSEHGFKKRTLLRSTTPSQLARRASNLLK